jgi:hypothetical protein
MVSDCIGFVLKVPSAFGRIQNGRRSAQRGIDHHERKMSGRNYKGLSALPFPLTTGGQATRFDLKADKFRHQRLGSSAFIALGICRGVVNLLLAIDIQSPSQQRIVL